MSYGGFSDAALKLTLTYHRLFSRQGVHKWWVNRDRTGFPDFTTITTGDGEQHLLDLDEVTRWYAGYVPARGGRPALHPRDCGDDYQDHYDSGSDDDPAA